MHRNTHPPFRSQRRHVRQSTYRSRHRCSHNLARAGRAPKVRFERNTKHCRFTFAPSLPPRRNPHRARLLRRLFLPRRTGEDRALAHIGRNIRFPAQTGHVPGCEWRAYLRAGSQLRCVPCRQNAPLRRAPSCAAIAQSAATAANPARQPRAAYQRSICPRMQRSHNSAYRANG